ncbi:hypothetical protein TNCV_3028361 [Trichonephila clavipes]|nr:hypothetical protein TNCV_3028361 [Trichonephila clavipes]
MTTPELAPPLPTTTPHQRKAFELSNDYTRIASLHGGSSVVQGLNSRHARHESVSLTIRLPRPRKSFKDGNRCRRLSGFQMLSDDEIVTSAQAESDPVDDEMDEDEENNNNESSKSTNNNQSAVLLNYCCSRKQSAVLLNYCCSRKTETLQPKNEGVQ